MKQISLIALVILAGIVSVFVGIESNEMLLLLTGAGIGYLFKNGIISRVNTPPLGPVVSTQ